MGSRRPLVSVCLYFCLSVSISCAFGTFARVEAGSIFPEGASLEKLFERSAPISGGLTEGPAVAPDGSIFFSDIPFGSDKGMILRFDPRSKKVTVFSNDSRKSNGLMFDRNGALLACEGADAGGRALVRYVLDPKTLRKVERKVLADLYQGKKLNAPNDLVVDAQGRIYFSDPRYVGAESRELEHRAVYRLDRSGRLVEVTRAVTKPNGIAISPDGKTLYVAETDNGTDRIDPAKPPPEIGLMRLVSFPLGADGLVSGPMKVLRDFGEQAGVDGMTLDRRGNLYLALRNANRPGVLVVDPAGKELDFLATGKPATAAAKVTGLPSNCVFGRGYESDVLYVTVDTALYRVRVNARGFHRPTAQQAEYLKIFHREFLAVTPGEGKFAEAAVIGRDGGPKNEAPARTVTFSKPFSIAKYEVPQNLWEAVMGFNPSRWKGPRNSVEVLDFDDAVRFCDEATWLMRRLGLIDATQKIRLPSEAEWEYCARAGTTTLYSYGDAVASLGEYAWFHGNAAGNDPPVGVKKPNAWNLYDVHGYLWEFCADTWHDTYEGAPKGPEAWTSRGTEGATFDKFVVLRGGSWKDGAEKLTSTFGRKAARGVKDDAVGLRCVLD